MVTHKHIAKIVAAVMALAVVLCFLAMIFSDRLSVWLGGTGVTMAYETALFDTDQIIEIDIRMEEDDWNAMLDNAIAEEYCECDVVVNGTKIRHVAIRPKGNTSLSAIAMNPDTNRYSFKLEFDHYVKGQSCYGLDKLILNNHYADATNMKEALVYDMYQFLGAKASLYNYAKVSVNGEYWGVYLALEAVEESFLLRNFGTQDGALYKPDSMNLGGDENGPPDMGDSPSAENGDSEGNSSGNSENAAPRENETPEAAEPEQTIETTVPEPSADQPDAETKENEGESSGESRGESPGAPAGDTAGAEGFDFDPDNLPDMGNFPDMGGFSMSGGADLNYTDDDLDSYSTIWEGEVTKTGKADHKRVVTALKHVSEGEDLETYLDVDNLLRYMAVHTFAVNQDSLSGNMAHNYYLYEYNGQLNLFPWDYNLSFGGMGMGGSSASEMINDAIDSPFSGTRFFDALLKDETYLEQYHAYLRQLVEEYVKGGRFDEVYQRIRSQIDELVKTDPTAFYSYEEYQTAADMLYQTIQLRADSIEGQLNGTIPSTDALQREDASALIDAELIDVDAMGSFNMGGDSDGSSFGGESPDGESPGGETPGERAS